MHINTKAVRGGMWATLEDDSRVGINSDAEERRAEITFFGSFEISIDMSEQTLVQCRDLCAKALREMPAAEEDAGPSWMHPAAPSA